MPCYHPVQAFRLVHLDGTTSISHDPRTQKRDGCFPFERPCGRCVGCRLQYSRSWAIRCMHEAQMHPESCFITLTYNERFLPKDKSLSVSVFQKFFKRLRRKFAKGFDYIDPVTGESFFFPRLKREVSVFYCGEYGDKLDRPHYHAIVFGCDFPDRRFYKTTPSGDRLFTSEVLSSLWTDPNTYDSFGFTTVGDVTFKSAAYVARYVMKKRKGLDAKDFYSSVSSDSGEVLTLLPPFAKMSCKPAIGKRYYDRYKKEIWVTDSVIVDGKELPVPRYYLDLLEREDFIKSDEVRLARQEFARLHPRTKVDLENMEAAQLRKLERLVRDKNIEDYD